MLISPDLLAAFQLKDLDSRRILKEIVDGPTAVYSSRFSLVVDSSFYANFTSATAVDVTSYVDAACATPATSTSESPNPLVIKFNQCNKISTSNDIVYYKPTSCVVGGKVEGIVYTDSACTDRAVVESVSSTDTGKCLNAANGRFEKVTCAFMPFAEDQGVLGNILQNVTDSIIHAFESTLSLQKGALFHVRSDHQITASNQSNGQIVFERKLLLFSLNSTTPPMLDGNVLTSNAVNFFRSNARTSEIRNLVSSATFTVRDRLFCGDVLLCISYFYFLKVTMIDQHQTVPPMKDSSETFEFTAAAQLLLLLPPPPSRFHLLTDPAFLQNLGKGIIFVCVCCSI
jgi:hypothetical protein